MLFIYEALRQKLPGCCLVKFKYGVYNARSPFWRWLNLQFALNLEKVDLNDMLHTDELQEGLTLHFLLSLEHLKSLLFVVYSQLHL